jgi:hypothetical protein
VQRSPGGGGATRRSCAHDQHTAAQRVAGCGRPVPRQHRPHLPTRGRQARQPDCTTACAPCRANPARAWLMLHAFVVSCGDRAGRRGVSISMATNNGVWCDAGACAGVLRRCRGRWRRPPPHGRPPSTCASAARGTPRRTSRPRTSGSPCCRCHSHVPAPVLIAAPRHSGHLS